jgi:uncharacterized membrane protein
MSQDEVETEERKDSWSAVLLEGLSGAPEPKSPLFVRLIYAAFLALIMPVMWPLLMGMMLLVFSLALVLVGVTMIFAPVWVVVFGISKERTERFEVEVDKDKASAVTAAVRGAGGRVSRR